MNNAPPVVTMGGVLHIAKLETKVGLGVLFISKCLISLYDAPPVGTMGGVLYIAKLETKVNYG